MLPCEQVMTMCIHIHSNVYIFILFYIYQERTRGTHIHFGGPLDSPSNREPTKLTHLMNSEAMQTLALLDYAHHLVDSLMFIVGPGAARRGAWGAGTERATAAAVGPGGRGAERGRGKGGGMANMLSSIIR